MDYLGKDIPKLGFGLMRLPANEDGSIDIPQTCKMVDMFLENGFTYFDTAYGYGDGASERAAKTALVDRYPREKFLLATKLPAWAGAASKEEAEQMLYTSLERTGAGYFDFYLLHNLGEERTHFFDDYDIWNFLAQKKKEGIIRNLGFSFHDKADALEEVLKAHPEMDFVQIQINYADWENPSVESRKCYEIARKYEKPVIIMEPVKGGTLANPPKAVRELMERENSTASPASWAIRYAASLEGVITVLSGMSNIAQMKDNISFMKDFKPLSEREQAVMEKARDILAEIPVIPCTACAYCMKGCPKKIAIYGSFQAYNSYLVYGDMGGAAGNYSWNTDGHGWGKASACIQCGKCEQVCPQHIAIRKELTKVAGLFEGQS